VQRYYCNTCKYSFQSGYSNNSYAINDSEIITLVKEGCGVRSISRILEISTTTVIRRIKRIARGIEKPSYIPIGKEYQIDELATYLGKKEKRIWITYAL
jgi:transposase-like protein